MIATTVASWRCTECEVAIRPPGTVAPSYASLKAVREHVIATDHEVIMHVTREPRRLTPSDAAVDCDARATE